MKEFFKDWGLSMFAIVVFIVVVLFIAYANRWFPFNRTNNKIETEEGRKQITSVSGNTSNLPPACEAWISCNPSVQDCRRYWRACQTQLGNV